METGDIRLLHQLDDYSNIYLKGLRHLRHLLLGTLVHQPSTYMSRGTLKIKKIKDTIQDLSDSTLDNQWSKKKSASNVQDDSRDSLSIDILNCIDMY